MSVLLLCLLVFLIPGCSPAGEFQLIGSPDPIGAVAGDDVILPCSLKPPMNAEFLRVVWFRHDQTLIPVLVHSYHNVRNLNGDQDASYEDRTKLFEGELVKGNVSLKLLGVKLEDEGSYTCRVVTTVGGGDSQEETVIHLRVGKVSIPVISIVGVNGTGMVLQCVAKSWYPKPELEWRESEGQLLHADVTQTDGGTDSYYTVRSNVTVQKTVTNKFTCKVELQGLNLTRETEIHVPDQLFPLKLGYYSFIVAGLSGFILLIIVAVAVGVWFCHFWKKHTSLSITIGPQADSDEPQTSVPMLPVIGVDHADQKIEVEEDEPQGIDVPMLPVIGVDHADQKIEVEKDEPQVIYFQGSQQVNNDRRGSGDSDDSGAGSGRDSALSQKCKIEDLFD